MSWNRKSAVLLLTALSACWLQPAVAAKVCPSQREQPLRFVDVFDGPVEELATLVPDRAQQYSGHWQLGYVYDAGRSVTIRCKYADGHVVDVPLPKRIRGCDYKINARKDLRLDCK